MKTQPILGDVKARHVAQASLIVAGSVTANLIYSHFFVSRDYLAPLIATAIAAAATALLTARRRLKPATMLVACAAPFPVVAMYALAREPLRFGILPSGDIAHELATGASHGIGRMLSVHLPADVTTDLLFVPGLLTWIAVVGAVLLAIRTRSPLAPAAPILALLGVAVAAVADVPVTHITPTTWIIIGSVAMALARTRSRRQIGRRQPSGPVRRRARVDLRLVAILSVVALTLSLGGPTRSLLPQAQRADPRDLVANTDAYSGVTPLALIRAQLQEPEVELFTVKATDPQLFDGLIRIATLETFDGVTWSSAEPCLLAGARLGPEVRGRRLITVQVSVAGLPRPYLPTVGTPTRLLAAGHDYRYCASTRTLVASGDRLLASTRYELISEADTAASALQSDSAAEGNELDLYTRLPAGLPDRVREIADDIAQRATTDVDRSRAVEQYVRAVPYSEQASPGHSYAAIERFLTSSDPREHAGYSEQHAAAFAVLARSLELPARVVVGYRHTAMRQADDTVVTTRHAHAWAEVHFSEHGWVAFEPTDPSVKPPNEQSATLPLPQATVPTANSQPSTAPREEHPRPETVGRPGTGQDPMPVSWLLLAIIVILALVCVFAAVLAMKVLRRKLRQMTGGPVSRVVGAWREAADRLRERGYRPHSSSTALEISVEAASVAGDGAAALSDLARSVTAASFAGTLPSASQVRHAWDLESAIRRSIRTGRWRHLRTVRDAIDPRPILPSRRSTRKVRR